MCASSCPRKVVRSFDVTRVGLDLSSSSSDGQRSFHEADARVVMAHIVQMDSIVSCDTQHICNRERHRWTFGRKSRRLTRCVCRPLTVCESGTGTDNGTLTSRRRLSHTTSRGPAFWNSQESFTTQPSIPPSRCQKHPIPSPSRRGKYANNHSSPGCTDIIVGGSYVAVEDSNCGGVGRINCLDEEKWRPTTIGWLSCAVNMTEDRVHSTGL